LELLIEFDYVVQHRPGSKHGNADALSRRLCLNRPSCTACHPETVKCSAVEVGLPLIFGEPANQPIWTLDEIASAQGKDKDLAVVIALLEVHTEKPPEKT